VRRATTDCGLGRRIHPQIAWVKLRDGAAIARGDQRERGSVDAVD